MTSACARLREALSLLLLGLLPFHALLVTVGTRVLAGPGQAPLGMLAAWKEAVIVLIVLCAIAEMLARRPALRLDRLDLCAAVFLCIGAAWFALRPGSQALYGVKYDLAPVVVFAVLRHVAWSEAFRRRMLLVLLGAGVLTAAYGLLTLFLPIEAFQMLGYGDLHSLYLASGPLPPFHDIGGTALRRMQAGFAGPNQLGLWLLLPWSIAWALLLQSPKRTFAAYAVLFTGFGIAASFSRAAWIAAIIVVIAVFAGSAAAPRRRTLLGTLAGIAVLIAMLFAAAPSVVVRIASSADHLRRPIAALQQLAVSPMGMGLGTAGPASNRFSNTCVDLPAGADVAWATEHPELCVFVAGTQVQPADTACACPVLPENWYLQLGLELGVFGMTAFLMLLFMILRALRPARLPIERAAWASLLGLAAAGMVLHAWEDAAVAYSSWMLLAVCLPPRALVKKA